MGAELGGSEAPCEAPLAEDWEDVLARSPVSSLERGTQAFHLPALELTLSAYVALDTPKNSAAFLLIL